MHSPLATTPGGTNASAHVSAASTTARVPMAIVVTLAVVAVAAALFFGLWRLTDFPATWFDEGSHLHVPKTLVQHGVYADISSEGYRYYGPTLGVGPTVMLPIAGAFSLFGIGLVQARLVMVIYLFAALWLFFLLAQQVSDRRTAIAATLLMAFTPSIAFFETGRQVLGEVPALAFLSAGLLFWFARWERARAWELLLAGLLMGLSAVTKYQFLLVLAPALLGAWLLNLLLRKRPQRLFLLPGIGAALTFGVWQVIFLTTMGPATFTENLASLREVTAGAAAVFSPDLMLRSMRALVSLRSYFYLLLPVIGWSLFRLVWPGRSIYAQMGAERRMQLSVVMMMVAVNLIWYVVASVSWVRYAFVGLALSSIFVALAFAQLTGGFRLSALTEQAAPQWRRVVAGGSLLLLAVMIIAPAARLGQRIVTIPVDPAKEMAVILDQVVDPTALVETWEPQMGFLTDHRYHYPPQLMLNRAVRQVWLSETPVSDLYDFRALQPDYVLMGEFSQWVGVYPADSLSDYEQVASSGAYQLYARR